MAADYYGELGIPRTASADDIKKAFRKLASQLHPDKNLGSSGAEARFKAVNRAYQVLSDKKKRALYDEFGEDGLREGFNADAARAYGRAGRGGQGGVPGGFDFEEVFSSGGGHGGFSDFMGDLFGGGVRGARRRGPSRSPDLASEVVIDFADAVRGATISLRLQQDAEPVAVRIPPGATDGDRVRVAGHGAPAPPGGTPGDLVISVRVRPHPHFEREGLDLHLDLPITVGEAYRGAKVTIPTPDGEVSLKVPSRAQSGQVVRLKGRGVKRRDRTGDLFVRFLIRLPDAEGREVEQAIEALDHADGSDVREGITF